MMWLAACPDVMQVWAELGIGQEDLVRWTENCRRVGER